MPSLYTKVAVIVILASVKPQGEAVALEIDPTTQGETFRAGLSTNGQLPITHYWCSWHMTEAEWLIAVNKIGNLPNVAWIYNADLWTLAAIRADRGLQYISAPL